MSFNDEIFIDSQFLPSLDEEFLSSLSEQQEREIYARISALDINENPIELIEGRVTGGSINIDGSSTVRRSCSLNMVSENIDINDFYWSIKTKFKLEIGLRNNLINEFSVENGYPEIVWFKQGTFLISSFNTSISTTSASISISGKDKMCLLNGEFGGQLFASIDFGTEEIKTSKMVAVSAADLQNNSEVLMARQNYVQNFTAPDTALVPLARNLEYVFILDNDTDTVAGKYYQYKGQYKYIVGDEQNLATIRQKKIYTRYDLIQTPDDLFTEIGTITDQEEFDENKDNLYYELDEGYHYYVPELANTPSAERVYYQIKEIFLLEYEYTKDKIPIVKIIKEAVHAYANEPYHNIIINDLSPYGLEQLSYTGDKTIYFIRPASGPNDSDTYSDIYLAQADPAKRRKILFTDPNNLTQTIETTLEEAETTGKFQFDKLEEAISGADTDSTVFSFKNAPAAHQGTYCAAAVKTEEDAGYRLTPLVYPDDLISSIGETITSILDKIKNFLGNFEYFYDTDGRFIFQRKRTYVDVSWDQITDNNDESYVNYVNSDRKKFAFNFEDNKLVTAISHSPTLTNVRNDFIVWGKRETTSGAEVPIHARYAIDKKPEWYKALDGTTYTTSEDLAIELLRINPDEKTPDARVLVIQNFELEYPAPDGFARPQKDPQRFTFGPGWWEIRDWYRYYTLLRGEEPTGTIKFYSRNDDTGCVNVSTIDGNYAGNQISKVWLVEILNNNTRNYGHGFGAYTPNNSRLCTFYTSAYNDQGNLVHTPTSRQEYFHAPYSGCSDNHTYLYFLDRINKGATKSVYFYNPQFDYGSGLDINEYVMEIIENGNGGNWLQNNHIKIVDWREIIYQMALDYFAAQGCSYTNPVYLCNYERVVQNNQVTINTVEDELTDPDHFLYEVGQRNPWHYPTGYTGYEQYYTDMQGFWRELYNPDYEPEAIYSTGGYTNIEVPTQTEGLNNVYKTWNASQITDYNIQYYFNAETHPQLQYSNALDNDVVTKYNNHRRLPTDKSLYWNINVFENPSALNFWIDFLDSEAELAQFSVKAISDRTKVINDDKIKAIVYKDIPGIIFYGDPGERTFAEDKEFVDLHKEIASKSGYVFCQLSKGFAQYFHISYRGTSAKNKIDDLIYQYGYCIENVTLTTIPIYYLEPNTRIYVSDPRININGEYFVNRLSIPLTYNGTMSITAIKAPERLY